MKQSSTTLNRITGWTLFIMAMGLFSLQLGFLVLQTKYNVEYIDNRLFYGINIGIAICLSATIGLLIKQTNKGRLIGSSIIFIFILINIFFLYGSHKQVNNIVRISPDYKHVLSIKENRKTGEAFYNKTSYGVFARPKESLPYRTTGNFKVDWLAKDVAAVTYKATDNTIHQYIGTYGDRGGGSSYYYVGPSIQGQWKGKDAKVISDTRGITVIYNGAVDVFNWNQVVQFGTLAVVLTRDNQAVWTISLNENFEVHSDSSIPQSGEISLYKATMKNNKPITLQYTN